MTAKKCTNKVCSTCKVVVAFLTFSLLSPSSDLKVPNIWLKMACKVCQLVCTTIVSRGDWLGKPPNIKVDNNGAVGYVGSSLTVHNPLIFVHKL